ncbi:hypothetical protein F0562_001796 [Nyssa sinensis]|uniref:Large ribosomal subunit protein uL2 C-terminal domain-containing protein n=1 Tax=Nyssa sinensis TaxID=561372 RepID=A0A5J5C825_9ASTE|nr:hypothetical protein F0562_001796 [Nyssa sinensis]
MAFCRARAASSTLLNKLLHHTLRPYSTSPDAFGSASQTTTPRKAAMMMNQMFTLDISSQIGSCMPLSMMRIGTQIHNVEMKPGQGGKLVRAAGTSAKILKMSPPSSERGFVQVLLPSGNKKVVDSRCRATIGAVSNPSHKYKKLRKAGHSRWLGRRPVVRGVAMNPVDHPHGGGLGKVWLELEEIVKFLTNGEIYPRRGVKNTSNSGSSIATGNIIAALLCSSNRKCFFDLHQ